MRIEMLSLGRTRSYSDDHRIRFLVANDGWLTLLCIAAIAAVMCGCSKPSKPTSLPTLQDTLAITDTQNSSALETSPVPVATPALESTGETEPLSGSWKTYPIIPDLSPRTFEIYQDGLASGNNPQAFSKVGDGEVATTWFLTAFDHETKVFDLGPYPDLANVIEHFSGSFGRESLAARAGFNTTRILDPLFVMNEFCEMEESPLECELRLHRPSYAIISLGTNQVWVPDIFDAELRQIVEICIQRGVIPILSTKGDNLEGDHRINAIIAQVAQEYEIPLWNFWLAIQSLPDQGLQPDGEHLSWAANDFTDPEAMSHAWPVRNLTALQVLQRLKLMLGPL